MRVLVLNGANLGRLGRREPDVHGTSSYATLRARCLQAGDRLGVEVDVRQTDAEHELLEWLHEAADASAAVVLNPGAWTRTSVALRDACTVITAALVEVHLTNVHAREEFRRTSFVSPVASAVIAGLGIDGYALALDWISGSREAVLHQTVPRSESSDPCREPLGSEQTHA